MVKNTLVIILIAFLNKVSTQTIDYITTTPISVQDPYFDNLLPTLKMIKSTTNISKERLLKVVKVIRFLLADEIEKNECDKLLEEIKESNDFPIPPFPDIDRIVDERLNTIKVSYDKENCERNSNVLQSNMPQNNTADFSKILAKISAALAKLKDQNDNLDIQNSPPLMGMFRSGKNICKNNQNPPLIEILGQSPNLQAKQAGINSMSRESKFNIPCQRATDILKETSNFVIPKGAYCDLPKNLNLNSILKDPKLNSGDLPFKVVPNSVSCVDADDSFAILFKPKQISMMQVYGNLLKKITITVLVPYHVSNLSEQVLKHV